MPLEYKKPFDNNISPVISIIIPVYNGEKVIERCLNSIYENSIGVTHETIVVDDGSKDNTENIVKKFPCRYFKTKNSGAAAARNVGIKNATGKILLFFDADVMLEKGTVKKFIDHFREDKDAYLIQGRWAKASPIPTFSSRFLLLKYTYNFKDLFKGKKRIEVANLETGCLGVRREVFDDFKGFDESYRFSGGEEHELGMRILEKYRIYYYPDIFVEHAFGSIIDTLAKIYRRTINFSMLSFKTKNKDFLELHKNSVPVQDKISVVLISMFSFCVLLSFLDLKAALMAALLLVVLYLLNILGFMKYAVSEEGIFFAFLAGLSDIVIMVPRMLGLAKAVLVYYILKKTDYKI